MTDLSVTETQTASLMQTNNGTYNKRLLLAYLVLFAGFYTVILSWPGGADNLVRDFGFFFLLGMAGALVANSTGAGGGVIFIPFFTGLGLTANQSVGTSMAIQCFGMTAGAISWLASFSREYLPQSKHYQLIKKLLLISGPTTIIGMLFGQYFLIENSLDVNHIFRIFSVVFGIILFVYTFMRKNKKDSGKTSLSPWEISLVVFTCFAGGIITSLISVGVGECIGLLLFFLGFNPRIAVAIGVYTSSISVLSGIVYHAWVINSVSVEILLFAGQAALVGGYVARHITNWLGGFYLKLFFAVWIFGAGLFMG